MADVRAVNGDGPTCGCGARSKLHVIVSPALDVFLCSGCTVEAVGARLVATGQTQQGPPPDPASVARHHGWGHHDHKPDRWCPECDAATA